MFTMSTGTLCLSCAALVLIGSSGWVRYLLKNNVGPDLCNEDGLTALHQPLGQRKPPQCLASGSGSVKTSKKGIEMYLSDTAAVGRYATLALQS
ncbi:unnamed protein product [Boreogadus saida]